jgi:hypothetical protein
MAYPQKLARDIIIGIADPINEHLIKLIAFQFDPQLRHHFRAELESLLSKIQESGLSRMPEPDLSGSTLTFCSIICSAASKFTTRVR